MNEFTNGFTDRQQAVLEAVLDDRPSNYGVFARSYQGSASCRHAIKAACLQCCWMDTKAISECGATECPLWRFRPYQRPDAVNDAK